MANVIVKQSFAIPASQIWDMIGQFNGLADWHPGIVKSELEEGGTRRRLTLEGGGGEIVEQLEAHDESGRLYSYSILESPLPIKGYAATIKVSENEGGGCTVEWSSDFQPLGPPTEVQDMIRGIYDAGFENLKKMFGG